MKPADAMKLVMHNPQDSKVDWKTRADALKSMTDGLDPVRQPGYICRHIYRRQIGVTVASVSLVVGVCDRKRRSKSSLLEWATRSNASSSSSRKTVACR